MAFLKPILGSRPESTSRLYARCDKCKLYKTCDSPKMPVTGEGRREILVVGEAPGEEEDRRNTQFVGSTGQLARDTCEEFGFDLDEDCWKTNALICRPPENRTPTSDEIDYCRPNLIKTIEILKPKVIVLMGKVAVDSLMKRVFREDTGPIGRWVGWRIPLQRYNAWVLPTYHPSYVRRAEHQTEGPVVRLWYRRHIGFASQLVDRPWDRVPTYSDEIQIVKHPERAAEKLDRIRESGGAISFDYETNRLKPDSDDAEIVSCAVCHQGKETIAYPWIGPAVDATKRLLTSSCPKLGANAKFETRWTRKILGVDVENWKWDTMLSAHHLDCRKGITSVKFQAMVRLGFEPWDHHIKSYLSSEDGTGRNRIRDLDLDQLLKYNGLDALIEYKLAQVQRREMKEGVDWLD